MLGLLRRNRDVRLLLAAQVVSYLGDWFADVALLGLVLDLTGSDFAAALLLVAGLLPSFLVTPLAGAAADRFDRRRLVVAVSAAQCAAALALLLVGDGRVWVAFAARGAVAALAAFVVPATQAAIPNLVDPDDLPTANALFGGVWGAMVAVGAALGGAFAVVFGRRASFVADAATFALAAVLVAAIRRPMGEETGRPTTRMQPMRDMREAIGYARASRPVLLLMLSKMGLGLAGGVVALLPVLATGTFDAGDAGIGALLAARGVGALVGPVMARRFMVGGVPAILLACGAAGLVYGAGYLAVAAAPMLWLAAVFVLVAHLGGGAQWILSTVGLQLATPDSLRGRIFAADFAMVTLTMSLSFLVAGALSASAGPRPVLVLLATVSVVWAFGYLALTRTARRDGAVASPAVVDPVTPREPQ